MSVIQIMFLVFQLRLGAEARYYPAPLWSTRQRVTVYKEIGNTIMKLLSVSLQLYDNTVGARIPYHPKSEH